MGIPTPGTGQSQLPTPPGRKHKRLQANSKWRTILSNTTSSQSLTDSIRWKWGSGWMPGMLEYALLAPQSHRHQRKRRRTHCNLTQHRTRLQRITHVSMWTLHLSIQLLLWVHRWKNTLAFGAQPRDGKLYLVEAWHEHSEILRTKLEGLIWPAWDCWQPGILSLEVLYYSEDVSRDLESALLSWQASRAGQLANKLILRSLALVRQ